jgi:TRAP-type C4-dicarboxylate transport system permease small subunit
MFRRGLDRVIDGAMLLAELAITLMMIHVTAEVLARWLFKHSFDATNEIVGFYYMAGLTFLSLAYVTRADGHISAEIFTQWLSPRALEILIGVIALMLFAYMAIFTWQTAREAMTMMNIGEIYQAARINLPKWPGRWYLPIGGALMAVCALAIGVRKLLGEPVRQRPAEFKPAAHE